ncbi:MAG: hypothetical protein IPO75_07945 [Betaproteobacteria bacterium]|nr:hypothetical protein [Betaproteobacteria bacterium]MBK9703396.1 hypothetical protein [Betaproteobacteria bacterium]
MSPLAKRSPPRPAARSAGEATPAAAPSLRFHHSVALRKETLAVLETIEAAKDPLPDREALADVVAKLIDSGVDYYFLRALRLAKVGFVVEQSAHLAAAGAVRVLASVTRNILLRMDRAQLRTVCGHIRHLME